MTQAELLDLIDSARTIDEVRRATEAAREWLKIHSGDMAVLMSGEGLAMLEEALQLA